jgi:hypothetical protein
MKLPSYRRLFKTDYAEDYQELVDKMAVSINNGFDTLFDALNNKLTFTDNILSTIQEFSVSVDSNGTPIKKNTQFKLAVGQTTLQGLIIIDCYEEKTNNPPPSAPFISFTKNEGNVIITNINGLTPITTYTVKVLALG